LSVSERGVDAASLSLLPQLSLNSHLVGSFLLKRPEGRAPSNRQLRDATRRPRRRGESTRRLHSAGRQSIV